MRTPQFAWVALVALATLLLACSVGIVLAPASAGEAGAPADKEKDKPKEKPFKYDAWCVFSDLAQDRPYISPNAPIDPETEHSRPGSEKLGGFGRRGQWAHVVLDLKNTTDPKDKTVYKGEATIVLNHFKPSDTSQTTYGTNYRQAFVVAPQSEKTYHFSIFCPEEGWNSALHLEIQLENGRTYFRDFHLYDLDQRNEELVVVVSDQPGSFKYLGPQIKNINDLADPMLTQREQAGRQIASVTPSELPTRWHDLALASLIIIDGPPAGGLSADQWDALKAYAQGGGKVLILAGKDPARLKGPVEELAGITVRNSAELANLDQFSTPFPASTEKNKELRVPVVEVTASPTTGLVKRNTKTQIIEYCAKSYGAGMVAFLPFSLSDKALEHWPDRALIPLNLIRAEKNLFAIDPQDDDSDTTSTTTNPYGNPYNRRQQQQREVRHSTLTSLRNSLDTSFSNDTPVITQSPNTVLYFMLIYLACAVPLNYMVFFVLRRREAAWLLAPLWALGFTIVAYYVGYAGQTGVVTVNEVCVIEAGPGQSTGVGRTFMGVYAPRRNDYQVVFPGTSQSGLEAYDTQAAPGHLVNSENVERREAEFPTMRLRENGEDLFIEDILVLQRSTRRFEIQHRTFLNRGLDLKFANPNGDQMTRPQIKITNNTGRTLLNPIFIKGGEYVEVAGGSANEFEPGQTFDSSMLSPNWRKVEDGMLEKMIGHFKREGGSQHDADRANFVANYLKAHMKQYAAGVFVAWADGASLPVKIGASGSKPDAPNLSGITLLVVPAQATNRGGRAISLKKNPPRAFFAAAFNPEDRASGTWNPCDAKPIPIKTPDEHSKKCVYLRLQFDPEFGQYVYEGKAVQLSFNITNKPGRNAVNFNGELNVLTRMDGATGKKDRFKALYSEAIAGLTPGRTLIVKPIKFQFSDTEQFTGSAIILKIQPEADDGTPLPDSIQIERVELKLIDR